MTVCDLTYDHEFIVLACDGIWDVMSNQEVVDFCRDRLAVGREPETVSLFIESSHLGQFAHYAKHCR